VYGIRTCWGLPVLKLGKKPEMERPAILKMSRPGVPGRVEEEVGGISMIITLQVHHSKNAREFLIH
jgi:hypothetical protein